MQTNAWRGNSISICKGGTGNKLEAMHTKTTDLKTTSELELSEKLKISSEVCQTTTNKYHSKVDRTEPIRFVLSQRYQMTYRKDLAQQ